MRAFADALDAVPLALSENSGLSPIETLASIKSRQVKEKNTRLGVDCMMTGTNGKPPGICHDHPHSPANFVSDMREHFAIDPLIGKRQQLLLATQLCRMVLKVRTVSKFVSVPSANNLQINNVIISGDDESEF